MKIPYICSNVNKNTSGRDWTLLPLLQASVSGSRLALESFGDKDAPSEKKTFKQLLVFIQHGTAATFPFSRICPWPGSMGGKNLKLSIIFILWNIWKFFHNPPLFTTLGRISWRSPATPSFLPTPNRPLFRPSFSGNTKATRHGSILIGKGFLCNWI